MRTWSAESAFVRAYAAVAVGVQAVLDARRTLERITRPPRQQWADLDYPEPVCPHDECEHPYGACSWQCDGAEQLAEREAEEEVSEPAECPTGYYVGDDEWYCVGCNGYFDNEAAFASHIADDADDPPNPTEPSLSDDEIVGVRGLLQERYEPKRVGYLHERGDALRCFCPICAPHLHTDPPASSASGDCTCPSWGNPSWPHRHGCPADSAATTETSAADSGGAVTGSFPPEPPVSPCPEDAAAQWIGWAVPGICTALHGHQPYKYHEDGLYWCLDSNGRNHATHGDWDWQAWLEHVAPIVAVHLQTAWEMR